MLQTVTKMEKVWESYSESEEPPPTKPKPKPVQVAPKTKGKGGQWASREYYVFLCEEVGNVNRV